MLPRHLCEATPSHHVVPLGALHLFALFVLEDFVRRDRKAGLHFPVVKSHHLDVLAETANQLDFVSQFIHAFVI